MSEVAGMDMSDFFHRYISGKEAIPYETYFAYAGIAVEKNSDAGKPWAGFASTTTDDGRTKITNVFPGSPAEAAGISKDDLVVAMDGRVVTGDEINEALGAHRPGDAVKLTVMRLGQLREFKLTLAADPTVAYKLKLVEHPTEMQQQIFRSWMGAK